jgi:hypothetical protein
MTCVHLKEPMLENSTHGLASIPWETRLERGPYVSEREDTKGTYFRGPAGAVRMQVVGRPPIPGVASIMDGGFYIPNNPKDAPKVYYYFTTADVPARVPPEELDCSGVGYIADAAGTKLDVVPIAVGMTIGGAAGGVAGRAMAGGGMGYGEAAGAGAAGGLIGGLIVVGIVNADVGNIHFAWDLQDPAFIARLNDLAAHKITIQQLPTTPPKP